MCNISGAFHYMYIFFSLALLVFRTKVEVGWIFFPCHSLLPPFFSLSPDELWAKCFRFRNNSMQNAKNIHIYSYIQTKRMQISVKMQTKANICFYLDNYNTQHQYLHDLHLKITNSASISIQMLIQKYWPCSAAVLSHRECARVHTNSIVCFMAMFCWYVLFCISKMI